MFVWYRYFLGAFEVLCDKVKNIDLLYKKPSGLTVGLILLSANETTIAI